MLGQLLSILHTVLYMYIFYKSIATVGIFKMHFFLLEFQCQLIASTGTSMSRPKNSYIPYFFFLSQMPVIIWYNMLPKCQKSNGFL